MTTTLGQTTEIDATVSIVSHNNRELVLGCLRSLTDDPGRRRSIEIVVLDNASEDGSARVIREAFPQVQLLAHDRRAGFGANQNLIARQARGRYLLILNDDTLVRPGSIDALIDYLESHPRVAVAGPRVCSSDGKLLTFVLRFPSLRGALREALWPWPAAERWPGMDARRVDWVNGCSMMVRRAAFDQVGGFDEGFFMYAEEKDFCRRAAQLGWETHLVPIAEVIHFGEKSTVDFSARREAEFWRSQHRYYRKHLGAFRGRLALLLVSASNVQLSLVAGLLSRLPVRLRPRPVRPEAAAEYRRYARAALVEPTRQGLRELANEWNERVDRKKGAAS